MANDGHAKGRLQSRPSGTGGAAPVGLRPLDDGGYLYVPAGYEARRPAPLVLLLHGAGEDARDGLALLRQQADGAGLILLALSSRGPTWDMILGRGRYGHDVAAIDEALTGTFSSYAVDSGRVAVGGYSDGASYALSLGISNGDLFGHVLAFSPGFMAPARRVDSPRLFVSHGTRDGWLPIDRTSRRLVPELEGAGYEVRYREFDGPHVVPPAIAQEAVDWFAGP
jgi:phospholipase/carboxylesterase